MSSYAQAYFPTQNRLLFLPFFPLPYVFAHVQASFFTVFPSPLYFRALNEKELDTFIARYQALKNPL